MKAPNRIPPLFTYTHTHTQNGKIQQYNTKREAENFLNERAAFPLVMQAYYEQLVR